MTNLLELDYIKNLWKLWGIFMNKQQQIEEIAKIIRVSYSKSPCTTDVAEEIYSAGYRKTYTSDLASDMQKAFKEGYEKAQAEKEQLYARLVKVLLSIDTVKEMNAMSNIDEQIKYAVQEFADKVKAKLLTIFGKTICSDLDTEDITDIIDELLKEYEQ